MKRLLPLLLLAACSEPTAPPQQPTPTPSPSPAPQAPAPTPAPAPAPAPAPTPSPPPDSAEAAQAVARAYLEARHPGQAIEVGGPGAMQGAAGSIYVEIPVTVGDRSGTLVLRRVNDVPGSTAEQRRWRVYSDTLE